MSKVAVVYWTMSGNTETMANAVADGAAGADVYQVSDFDAAKVADYDAFAFGCPAMGSEELDHDEFEPVWDECVKVFGDKPVALFGSYDWGTGEWMETWKDAAESAGATSSIPSSPISTRTTTRSPRSRSWVPRSRSSACAGRGNLPTNESAAIWPGPSSSGLYYGLRA